MHSTMPPCQLSVYFLTPAMAELFRRNLPWPNNTDKTQESGRIIPTKPAMAKLFRQNPRKRPNNSAMAAVGKYTLNLVLLGKKAWWQPCIIGFNFAWMGYIVDF